MMFDDAGTCRKAGVTYHLVSAAAWASADREVPYVPEGFDVDEFIHCTNGLKEPMAVGNRYYRDDARDFHVVVLSVGRFDAPVRYDDPEQLFPHVYGPLNRDAVISRMRAIRQPDGTFTGFVALV